MRTLPRPCSSPTMPLPARCAIVNFRRLRENNIDRAQTAECHLSCAAPIDGDASHEAALHAPFLADQSSRVLQMKISNEKITSFKSIDLSDLHNDILIIEAGQ